MSSNLDYLNPSLLPLEDKINAYLAAEKELHAAERDSATLPVQQQRQALAADEFEQRPATGSFPQHEEELRDTLQNLRQDIRRLQQEIVEMLPVRNEWVKVNLGYGPSRVGAFLLPDQPTETYELRIVH
jgi:hypothetical protein